MTFLTIQELSELTGYRRRSGQCEWLDDNGYPYELDKDGKPKVLKSVVLGRIGGEFNESFEPQLNL